MNNKNSILIFPLMVIGLVLIIANGCKKDENNQVNSVQIPVLTTVTISNIMQTTASCGGNITSDGGSTVTARGVCWSTGQTPTITDSKTIDGIGTGSFTSAITSLTANTTYYVRAYATNSAGTGYGTIISFTTLHELKLPTLTTSAVSSISQVSATCGGIITSDGGATIIARGICWSTNQNPTNLDYTTTDGAGNGIFISNLTILTANTTYYVRAYATNSVGIAFGNQISFTTTAIPNCGTVTDIDGNVYNTVTIGTQCWMRENLKTTKYRNGDPIQKVQNILVSNQWSILTSGAYFNSDNNYTNIYGNLYNWYAVNDVRNIAPVGWHVATDADWTTLTDYLGGLGIAGGKLKESGTIHWDSPNIGGTNNIGVKIGATNESGFTALPGSSIDRDGVDYAVGYLGQWWTSTVGGTGTWGPWTRSMKHDIGYVFREGRDERNGFSVRCVKD
ncbi:MAG: hypothetical protein EHM93_05180 [Bacteroidales bacterium]|nr:MAG: hypothetical protein EHM93_05180 [Bacteroidales bacterium]